MLFALKDGYDASAVFRKLIVSYEDRAVEIRVFVAVVFEYAVKVLPKVDAAATVVLYGVNAVFMSVFVAEVFEYPAKVLPKVDAAATVVL